MYNYTMYVERKQISAGLNNLNSPYKLTKRFEVQKVISLQNQIEGDIEANRVLIIYEKAKTIKQD